MLVGSYEHTVDAKGRVFVPSKYRLDLGPHFYLFKSHDGCIRAYSEEQWAKVLEKLADTTAKSLKVKRRILATTIEVDMDGQGRVLLPEDLRIKTMIFDKVKIVGMSEWAEFWNPDKYEQVLLSDSEEEDIEMLETIGLA